MFDPKCHELAQHFLPSPESPADDVDSLAQHIQDAVDDWLCGQGSSGFTPALNAKIFGLD